MGEAKCRSIQGLPPKLVKPKRPKEIDTSPRIAAWLPLTRNQADRFVTLTTKGAWIGIGALVLLADGAFCRPRRRLVEPVRRLTRQILKKRLESS